MSEKSRRCHRHNSYRGHARMMQMQAIHIANSDSTTQETKELADKIYDLAVALGESLKKRVDNDT